MLHMRKPYVQPCSTPNIECSIGSWLSDELFGIVHCWFVTSGGGYIVVRLFFAGDCCMGWLVQSTSRVSSFPSLPYFIDIYIYIYILVASSVTTHLSIRDVVYGGIVPHVHVVIRRILWLWLWLLLRLMLW
jgi:hypothetical protein